MLYLIYNVRPKNDIHNDLCKITGIGEENDSKGRDESQLDDSDPKIEQSI